jgi:transcription elongation factor
MKKVEIIPIAKKKSGQRGISVEWIEETINYPDQIVEGYGERKVAQKKYIIKDKEYLLRVVYEEKEEMNVVLTAYLTSQVVRYWKE